MSHDRQRMHGNHAQDILHEESCFPKTKIVHFVQDDTIKDFFCALLESQNYEVNEEMALISVLNDILSQKAAYLSSAIL